MTPYDFTTKPKLVPSPPLDIALSALDVPEAASLKTSKRSQDQ